jgi:hypothetical protein
MSDNVALPEGTAFSRFAPIAYYDKHMDCIRVLTHDRSVTEHRLDGFFTLCECNNRGPLDPEYVGFVIKGVRHLFAQAGLPLEGVYKLAELIDRLVRHQPSSTMSRMLRLIYKDYSGAGDLEIDFKDAA